jgi:hypothetical protein
MVACLVYDAFRPFAVHVLGWMGDFIPVMGTWVTGDPDKTACAVVGYLWRGRPGSAWGHTDRSPDIRPCPRALLPGGTARMGRWPLAMVATPLGKSVGEAAPRDRTVSSRGG